MRFLIKTKLGSRSRRGAGAPLVDSALLRFVSAEKKKQQQLDDSLSQVSMSSIYGADGSTSIDKPTQTVDEDTAVPPLLPMDQLEDPWMGQYNRNRISRTLVSLGVSKPLASRAGEKVQDYILVRMARRRVLTFLRERDSLWRDPSNVKWSSSKLREFNSILTTEPTHPNYGFEDVVKVLQEYGLTGTDICTILTHSPSLALMMPKESFADESKSLSVETLEQALDRSFQGTLMTTLGLRKYDARKVLRNCPGLLTARGAKSAVQIVSMMTKMGVSTSAIARDKTALPALLSRSPSDLFRLVSFLSRGSVRMKLDSIGPMLRRKSSFELLEIVAPVFRLHQPAEEEDSNIELTLYGKTREERKKRIDDVYKNMTMTAEALRYEIGTKDLGKVIAAYPSVLLLNAEEIILPTAAFLMDELGIEEGELASTLQLYPMLLNKDIGEMQRVVSYLASLGVKEEDLGSIFRSFPALLTTDIENDMVPVVEYLQSIGIQDIGSFITKLPPVLGYSVEKELQPKWEYLKRACFRPYFELEQFPAYFSYPFERVIKTRFDYLAAKKMARLLIPVAKVLVFGDVDFATQVARDKDGGKRFRAFVEGRRKGIRQPVQKRRKPKTNKPRRLKNKNDDSNA
jgi:hypothetical protein